MYVYILYITLNLYETEEKGEKEKSREEGRRNQFPSMMIRFGFSSLPFLTFQTEINMKGQIQNTLSYLYQKQ